MKFIKNMLIAVTFFAAITVQSDSFAKLRRKKVQPVQPVAQIVPVGAAIDADTVVTVEREKVEQAVIDTEKIKTAATLAINAANDQLAKGEISYVQAAQIIGENNYKIKQAKKQLAELTGQAIDNVEDAQAQESYYGQLLEKVGYSSTAQEKAIAQAIIDELKNKLQMLDNDYTEKMKADITPQQKMKLSQEYAADKKEIEDEIYRQQTITEEVMSTNKKLFWSAVGLAGAVVGGALAYQYLGTEAPAAKVEDVLIETPQTTRITPGLLTLEEQKLLEEPKGPFHTMPEPTEIGTVLRTPEEEKLMQQPVGPFDTIPEPTAEGIRVLLTNPEEKKLMEEPEGPFNTLPEPSAEEVYARITTPDERALRPFNDEIDEVTQARSKRIKAGIESGIEGAREFGRRYRELSAQALEESDNQSSTVLPEPVIEAVIEEPIMVEPIPATKEQSAIEPASATIATEEPSETGNPEDVEENTEVIEAPEEEGSTGLSSVPGGDTTTNEENAAEEE